MKKIVVISLLVCLQLQLLAQTQVGGTGSPIYYNGKQVGVGYNQPTAQLSLGIWNAGECGSLGGEQLTVSGLHNSGANLGGIKLLIEGYDNDGTVTYPIFLKDENYNVDYWIKNRPAANGLPTMYFAGNIGIGTTAPSAKLHVKGAVNIVGEKWEEGPAIPKVLSVADPSDESKTISLGYDDTSDIGVLVSVDRGTRWKNTAIQPYGGYVGIGTLNPREKLDVNGTIRATEIKVEAQTADFVFEEDYQLRNFRRSRAICSREQTLAGYSFRTTDGGRRCWLS